MEELSDSKATAARHAWAWLKSYRIALGAKPAGAIIVAEARRAFGELVRVNPNIQISQTQFNQIFQSLIDDRWGEMEQGIQVQAGSGHAPKVAYHLPRSSNALAVDPTPMTGPANFLRAGYKLDQTGRPKAVIENVVAALMDPQACGMDIRFDVFRAELMITIAGRNEWRPFVDGDAVDLRMQLADSGFAPVGRELMRDALTLIARDRQFDSAAHWLDHEVPQWDGVPRVETALVDYFNASDNAYTRAVSLYLFTAIPGRVLCPGCQADMALVFVGAQGVGKSSAAAALSPSPDFFGELSFGEKDADQSRAIRGKLILELSELRGLKTRDAESIKGLITRRHERWTPKYKEYETSYPRRCVFIGTTNTMEFLADETGERRWLPVRIEAQINIHALNGVLPQLWAEGREQYRNNGVMWREAQALASYQHQAFKDQDVWADQIVEWLASSGHMGLAPPASFTTLDVLRDVLGFEARQVGQREKNRVSRILREAGFALKSVWRTNRSVWAWVRDSPNITPSRD